MTRLVSDADIDAALLQPSNIALLEESLAKDIEHYFRLERGPEHSEWSRPMTLNECKTRFQGEIIPLVNSILHPATGSNPRVVGAFHIGSETLGAALCLDLLSGYLLENTERKRSGKRTRRQFLSSLLITGACATVAFQNTLKQFSEKYDPFTEQITVDPNSPFGPLEVLAHEYTHHIQHDYDLDQRLNKAFTEGHARGIQRKVAEHYDSIHLGAMRRFYVQFLDEVCVTYNWATRETGVTRHIREYPWVEQRYIDDHSKGHAFFRIKEEQFGPDVYRIALNDPLVMLTDGPSNKKKQNEM